MTITTPTGSVADGPQAHVVPLAGPDGRPVGVVIVDRGRARYQPVVDLERIAWCAAALPPLRPRARRPW